eukprot:scaffold313402_cov10-Tisochrysis_lutea.AAC.1
MQLAPPSQKKVVVPAHMEDLPAHHIHKHKRAATGCYLIMEQDMVSEAKQAEDVCVPFFQNI